MSKQTELVGLARTTKLDEVNDAYDAGALSNRNMIVNGAMNVAQRATSVSDVGITVGYFTCDRWKYTEALNTVGRLTMSQASDGPNGISANCLKLDCTTVDTSIAAGEFIRIQQIFEGQNLQRIGKGVAGAKQITVSFYVKANAALTFACELYDANNGRQISKLFSTTTSWSRIELTFPADVDDGSSPFNDDNARSLDLSFIIHAGSNYTSGTLNSSSWTNLVSANRATGIDSFFSSTNNNFFITGVQMEVGPVATEFEHTSYSEELAACQRYFESFYMESSNSGSFGVAYNESTSEARGVIPLQVEKRAAPTVSSSAASTFCNVSTNSTVAANSISFDSLHQKSLRYICVSGNTALVDGGASMLKRFQGTAFIHVDAEL